MPSSNAPKPNQLLLKKTPLIVPQQMRPYVIKQGDYLTKLAFVHGFDADEIWNHEKNAPIKTKRQSPDILYPGDVLYIPVTRTGGLAVRQGGGNRYVARVPTVEVTLTLCRDDTPLSDMDCTVLSPATTVTKMRTSSNGTITLAVPVTAREVVLECPSIHTRYRVAVGAMDPVDESTGVRKRFDNLGYGVADKDYPELAAADELSAIEALKFGKDTSDWLSLLLDIHGS